MITAPAHRESFPWTISAVEFFRKHVPWLLGTDQAIYELKTTAKHRSLPRLDLSALRLYDAQACMQSRKEYAMTARRSQDAQSVPHVILKSQLLSSKEMLSTVLLMWGQSRGK